MTGETCKKNRPELPVAKAAALYVHVPFCRSRCHYCDFYSLAAKNDLHKSFIAAAEAELAACSSNISSPLASVFIGGGTPTALPMHLLERLLLAVRPYADVRTEVTVEANPGTIRADVVEMLKKNGVNRLSLGVQSFIEQELRTLGRIHNARQAQQAVAIAREGGLDNINIDLIYGIPRQSCGSWLQSVRMALDLKPQHVSCYALSFEASTPLERDLRAGKLSPGGEAEQRNCYYAAIGALTKANFEHYEISNFAAGGARCVHNMTYWHNEPYIGIGPSAVSYVAGVRSRTNCEADTYISSLLAGGKPGQTSESLTGRQLWAETLMLELRLREGVDRRRFAARFGVDPVEAFRWSLTLYAGQGALEVTPSHVRLRQDFLFVADSILADIVAEA